MTLIFSGEGGIGKTSSLGMLALDWKDNKRPELQRFQFVFLVLLRLVDKNNKIEEIILKQHGRLETEKVSACEMKAILQGETKSNILLIFDGFDEYTQGTNEDIEELLLNGKDNCLIIVSSRSGDFLHQIKNHMDEEVVITGFSSENIVKCAQQYLGPGESLDEFLAQVEKAGILERQPNVYMYMQTHKNDNADDDEVVDYDSGILRIPKSQCGPTYYSLKSLKSHYEGEDVNYYSGLLRTPKIHYEREYATHYSGLLRIPIILLMACVIFKKEKCLPSRKTLLFKKVVRMSMSRTILKKMKKTLNEVENLQELMVKLGKLAWAALNQENKQLLLEKVM